MCAERLRLRPDAAAVLQNPSLGGDLVQDGAGHGIDAVCQGEPVERIGLAEEALVPGHEPVAVQQPDPFEVMARLDDASGISRRRTELVGEEFNQASGDEETIDRTSGWLGKGDVLRLDTGG